MAITQQPNMGNKDKQQQQKKNPQQQTGGSQNVPNRDPNLRTPRKESEQVTDIEEERDS